MHILYVKLIYIYISWKIEEANELPECMKVCFWMLSSTIEEMAMEIQMEKGWTTVLPHLKKAVSNLNHPDY